MSVGERITELRKAQNLSQTALAKAMDVSRQAVSKWENDLAAPDSDKLILLAEVLDTEVEYLATGRHPVYEEPPIVLNVVKKVDKVIEKPVIKRVTRVKYVRNSLEFLAVGIAAFLLGLVVGFLI